MTPEQTYDLARSEVHRVCNGLQPADRDDAIQEAAIRMWQQGHRVDTARPQAEQTAYLRRTARSGAMNFLAWRSRRREVVGAAWEGDRIEEGDTRVRVVPIDATTPEGTLDAAQLMQEIETLLEAAWRRLSPREAELLKDRLGIEPMSEDLASRHFGTRGVLMTRGRRKLLDLATELGCVCLDTTTINGFFAA